MNPHIDRRSARASQTRQGGIAARRGITLPATLDSAALSGLAASLAAILWHGSPAMGWRWWWIPGHGERLDLTGGPPGAASSPLKGDDAARDAL
jgi:hypothetical protein